MARRLTKKQAGFVKDYLETGIGSLSVKRNYNVTTDTSARVIASKLLTTANVQKVLESRSLVAKDIIYELAQHGESDNIRLLASKDIIDRVDGKAVERSININVPATVEISEAIARKNMAQPQQKD